jgi:hypothetical protein
VYSAWTIIVFYWIFFAALAFMRPFMKGFL